MHRLTGRDLAWLRAALAVWLACAGLHAYRAARGVLAWPEFCVIAGGADGYPTVSRRRSGYAEEKAPTLRAGDALRT